MLYANELLMIAVIALMGVASAIVGARAAFMLAHTEEVSGTVTEYFDADTSKSKSAPEHIEWAKDRLAQENLSALLDMDQQSVGRIYILEALYCGELIRVSVVTGRAFERQLRVGEAVSLLIDRRDPRVARFGSRIWSFICVVFCLPAGIAVTFTMLFWLAQAL